MRGTLEVYHAFIRDLDASDTSTSTNNEQDWELVDDGEHETDAESSTHNQVSFGVALSIFLTPGFFQKGKNDWIICIFFLNRLDFLFLFVAFPEHFLVPLSKV